VTTAPFIALGARFVRFHDIDGAIDVIGIRFTNRLYDAVLARSAAHIAA